MLGDSQTINIKEMGQGDICFYKIKTTDGVLAIDLDGVDYANDVIVEYIEFESPEVGSAVSREMSGAPFTGMMVKSETFIPVEEDDIED